MTVPRIKDILLGALSGLAWGVFFAAVFVPIVIAGVVAFAVFAMSLDTR